MAALFSSFIYTHMHTHTWLKVLCGPTQQFRHYLVQVSTECAFTSHYPSKSISMMLRKRCSCKAGLVLGQICFLSMNVGQPQWGYRQTVIYFMVHKLVQYTLLTTFKSHKMKLVIMSWTCQNGSCTVNYNVFLTGFLSQNAEIWLLVVWHKIYCLLGSVSSQHIIWKQRSSNNPTLLKIARFNIVMQLTLVMTQTKLSFFSWYYVLLLWLTPFWNLIDVI